MREQPSKHCKYCDVDYPAEEVRCVRCHGRLEPILTAAVLPKTEERAAPPETPSAPRPKLAASNPHVARARRVSERQRDLFPLDENPKVVELPAKKKAQGDVRRAAPKKKPANPDQYKFEFVEMPAPRQPLKQEFSSENSPFRVAPLAMRASTAVFDLGVTAAMVGLFAAMLHWFGQWVTGESLLRREWWTYLAAAPPLIAFAYKLLWCVGRRDTLGVEAMGLTLVSFDGTAPTQGQRLCRLLVGWLSVGGSGLGIVWALFDQEKLTWHDHASQTFLTARGQER